MSNKKQTAVEFLEQTFLKRMQEVYFISKYDLKLFEQAKAMHKDEIIKAINEVSENNVKYANMIIASWSQIEGELFMHNTKLAEQYYKETYEQ
jgi:hypothetical protein